MNNNKNRLKACECVEIYLYRELSVIFVDDKLVV